MDFKITSSQQNFNLNNFASEYPLWNNLGCVIFNHRYTRSQLNFAFNKAIELNDSLRLKITQTNNGYVANVSDYEYIDIPFFSFNSKQELTEMSKQLINERIELTGNLRKFIIFQTPEGSGMILFAHHIIVDGFCLRSITSQLHHFLENGNEEFGLVDSYETYIKKDEDYKISKRFNRDKSFWIEQFSSMPRCSIISQDRANWDYNASEENEKISHDVFIKIRDFCDKNDISVQAFVNTVYGVYLSRRYDSERFTIGVPVLNRTTEAELNTVGLYMHILPLIVDVADGSFLQLAKVIEDSQMTLYRHQKFTQHDIKEMLKEQNTPINSLFDVACDYQEFPKNDEYEMFFQYSNALSVPLEIHLQTFNEVEHNLKIRYRTAFFNETEVQEMLESIVNIMEYSVDHADESIYDIPMCSEKTLQKVLFDFNDTGVDYPRDKCIHELFEEQAERTPNKVALVAVDKTLTYKELNEEANRIAHSLMEKGIGKGDIVGLMLPRKSYLLSALFGILKTGAAYLPIDMELPKERVEYMCEDTNAKFVVSVDNIESLMQSNGVSNPNVEMSNDSLCYCIYTSGSTGQPKGVMARHRNVVNYISKNEHNIFGKIIKDDFEAIVSISTCSFDIFVTETIATLVNGFRVVLADEQQCRNQHALNKLLTKEKGEFLQTTPTKLKVLTAEPTQRDFLKNVKAILLGGEAMEMSYLNELKKMTNAKIYNIYGTTEVPIWSTFADTDTFVDAVTVGKPIANTQVYILDKYLKPTPIGVMGELCIAGESVSLGYLNNQEQTTEKFVDNPFGAGKMYRTGDLAFWRNDGNIVYIGRNDFQVKIRGLRIELGEIESVLQTVEGVERAVVVVRQDNDGRQLICAFYTGKELEVKELRKTLSVKLPRYMVPHVFTHLEKMPMTASGKANRNALPEIDLENISVGTEYVAPSTKEEVLLVACISNVLDVEKIGIYDNFFDMGGDSLKSIELVSELENKGYTVNVKEIFDALNIQDLANKMTVKEDADETVAYDSVLPATAAQMRVYTAQIIKPDATHYNITYAFKVKSVDKDRLENAVNKLIARHDSLRTHFESIDGKTYQVIDDKASIKVGKLSDDELNNLAKPFDLAKAPLIRVYCNENTVAIDLHHITVDGESMPVIFGELNELYMGRELSDTVQYGEFAVTDNSTEENEKYWLSVFNEELTPIEMPLDYQRTEVQSFNGSQLYEVVDIDLHNKIIEKCKELSITPYAYYMTCYNILLSKYSGCEDICVGVPFSGRSGKFLDTVGMFVNTVALRNNVCGDKTVRELAQEVRENSVSAISNQNYPFNDLIKKLDINSIGRNPVFDVMFAYQSFEMTDISFGDEKAEIIPLTTTSAKCDMTFNILPRKDDVVIMADYCTDLYKEETILRFVDSFKKILSISLNENILIKDIDAKTEEEKETVINTFNATEHTYDIPEKSTIYSLFEERARENKEKVCITANGKEITYIELAAYAERIDSKVRAVTDNEKSVIAVICERSIEMYGAIYGIIRGGNAYLPIDPNYPQERIEYILENSEAKAVITQEKFCHLAGKVPCIDATAVLNSTEQPVSTECIALPDDTAYVIYTSGSTGKPKGAKISHKSAINRILWMHDKYPLEENDVILQKTPYTFDVSVWELFWWGITGRSLCASKPDEHFLPAKILDECNKHSVTHLHFVPSVFDLFLTYLENNPEEQAKFNTVKYVFLSGEALTAKHINRFYKIYDYNKVTIHNLYGPTECAVDVSYYDCLPTDTDPVPIGKPIYNTQLYIVDKYLKATPIGVTGELCIAGENVGQGYLNNPTLTKEKFIENPFGKGKLYRTGDLAYWRKDGEICYVGRNDFQVKINGQRIELGEIENAITRIDGVVQCAVIVREQYICAFYTGKETEAKEMRAKLSAKLPRYMVPHSITHLDNLPMTVSGKLDRKALPEIDISSISEETEYVAPKTEKEKIICNSFKSILNVEHVGRNSDFFDLGGTSISMISLLSEEYFESISPAEFIANSTPMALAVLMNGQDKNKYEFIETLKNSNSSTRAIICFPYAGGGAESYATFSKDFAEKTQDYSLFFVPFLRSHNECEKAAQEIVELAKNYELYFYSHCAGAVVAMNILNILEGNGNNVIKHYISAGIIPPESPRKDNYWNTVSNDYLLNGLQRAGGNYEGLSNEQIIKMLDDFRKDTDFMTEYYCTCDKVIKAPISLVMSKTDIFTENYIDAERLWSRYSKNLKGIHFIETNSHYFQKDKSKDLVDIVLSIIE